MAPAHRVSGPLLQRQPQSDEPEAARVFFGLRLSAQDRHRIEELLRLQPPASTAPLRGYPGGIYFVLHDTGRAFSAHALRERERLGSGVAGQGAAAYVPAQGAPTMAHRAFFLEQRATATQYERVADLLPPATRDPLLRVAWRSADARTQEAALAAAMADSSMNEVERRTIIEGRAGERPLPSIRDQLLGDGEISTTALIAVDRVCDFARNYGFGVVAASPQTRAPLLDACTRLRPYYDMRRERFRTHTNIEIVHDAPASGQQFAPYTEDQYQNVARLYLQAAYEATVYPQITTHLVVDRGVGNHCDPHCFRLEHLYAVIASMLRHPRGSSYGVLPIYGRCTPEAFQRHGVTVHWENGLCGDPPPSP